MSILLNTFTQVAARRFQSASYSDTLSVSGTFLVVAVGVTGAAANGGLADLTASYGGVTMTRRAFRLQASGIASVAIFTLVNPPTGSNTLLVNTPGVSAANGANSYSAAAWDLSAVNGFVTATVSDGDNPISVGLTPAANNAFLIGYAAMRNAVSATLDAGWTNRANGTTQANANSDHGYAAFDRTAGPTPQTATITFDITASSCAAALIELAAITFTPIDADAAGTLPLGGSAGAAAIAAASAGAVLPLSATSSAIAIATATATVLLELDAVGATATVITSTVAATIPLFASASALVAMPVEPRFRFALPARKRRFTLPAPGQQGASPMDYFDTADPKDPSAILDYEFDASLVLAEGETLVSASVSTTTPGLSITMVQISEGRFVSWRASGGAAGSDYIITLEYDTSAGQRDQASIRFPVREK